MDIMDPTQNGGSMTINGPVLWTQDEVPLVTQQEGPRPAEPNIQISTDVIFHKWEPTSEEHSLEYIGSLISYHDPTQYSFGGLVLFDTGPIPTPSRGLSFYGDYEPDLTNHTVQFITRDVLPSRSLVPPPIADLSPGARYGWKSQRLGVDLGIEPQGSTLDVMSSYGGWWRDRRTDKRKSFVPVQNAHGVIPFWTYTGDLGIVTVDDVTWERDLNNWGWDVTFHGVYVMVNQLKYTGESSIKFRWGVFSHRDDFYESSVGSTDVWVKLDACVIHEDWSDPYEVSYRELKCHVYDSQSNDPPPRCYDPSIWRLCIAICEDDDLEGYHRTTTEKLLVKSPYYLSPSHPNYEDPNDPDPPPDPDPPE